MGFLSFIDLHTFYLFIFSIALGLGLGVSVLSHMFFLFSTNNESKTYDEYRLLKLSQKISWLAILLYGFSGLGLFILAHESMLKLGIFYASMMVVTVLIVNELILSFRYLRRIPIAHSSKGAHTTSLHVNKAVSMVSWIFLMFHHVMYRADIGYFAFMALYMGSVALAVLVILLVRKNKAQDHNVKILKKSFVVVLLLTIFFIGGWYTNLERIFNTVKIGNSLTVVTTGTTYTVDDVALHNNSEDCWLIIDSKVFNATDASRLHPAMFNCGQDVSENYHKNHGEGVRDKMMKFYIGDLRIGKGVSNVDIPFEKNKDLKPYRELYVEEKSWNPRELMLVVEKDDEKLLAIDGTTHKAIGRVHSVGFQPHTSVFSSDAKYMYIISRDGWLTKINLVTLEPVMSVSVGENSRGTAITDNDKYIAVGNYAPGNLVILDTETLKTLVTIPLTAEMDGKEIESRAGAVVEDGNRIIVALKDANSVWAIDTDEPSFPITHKFTNIGNNVPALHDAFLTPGGKHYIVASQGSKSAWVLDLATMKPIAEIVTGETPHTGPGAAWGDYIYIPSLGEGLITVIDTRTWKPAKYIKTGGPGLFVRSYSKNPLYPYVWADTAFGDHQDEIYVIDARVNEIVKTIIPVKGESSWHPEFTYGGKFVYVVSQSANEVEVYNANSFELVKRIPSNTPSAISNVGLRIEEFGL